MMMNVWVLSLVCLLGGARGADAGAWRQDPPSQRAAAGAAMTAPAVPPVVFLLEQVLGALEDHLTNDFGRPLRVHLTSSPQVSGIQEISRFVVEDVAFDPRNKNVSAKAIFYDKAQNSRTIALNGHVVFLKRVPVFKEAMDVGERCRMENLKWQILDDDHRSREVITDTGVLEGAAARRPIRPGDMPTEKNLKTSEEVARGDLVELVYQSSNLRIAVSGGRALAKGRAGDTIPVMNPMASRGGKSLWGTIESGRRVRINTSS